MGECDSSSRRGARGANSDGGECDGSWYGSDIDGYQGGRNEMKAGVKVSDH